MALRLVLLALTGLLSPATLPAAVQQRTQVQQETRPELHKPRKKSFFPNEYARRYHYRLLKRDTAAALRFALITTLVGLAFYGLLQLAYLNAGGVAGWVWGILISSFGVIVMGVLLVLLIRWLFFWFSGLLRRLRIPAFRRRYRRCLVR